MVQFNILFLRSVYICITKSWHLGRHLYRATEIKAKEGERCANTSGPFCDDGLTCIGKIQLVNGLGTCRQIGTFDKA